MNQPRLLTNRSDDEVLYVAEDKRWTWPRHMCNECIMAKHIKIAVKLSLSILPTATKSCFPFPASLAFAIELNLDIVWSANWRIVG